MAVTFSMESEVLSSVDMMYQMSFNLLFPEYVYYIAGFILAFAITFITTPWVKKLAVRIGAVDQPNHRKVHQHVMPRLGGLAIFIGFALVYFFLMPFNKLSIGLFLGGLIIVILGILDDKYEISPKSKLIGQILAAFTVVGFGLEVHFFNLPFEQGQWILGWLAIPMTIFWIVGVTNAVNLIDGLDGLAAGVSGIATAVMLVMAIIMGNVFVAIYCAILLGSIFAFLFFNFYPAKIFMGDTGALFLGFNLAALSLLGFKQVTLVSFVIPLLILGVPLSDTFFAIIRRIVNQQPISTADKNHLHHCLLALGFGHRKTVLIIYIISIAFGTCAIVLTQSSHLWIGIIIIGAVLIALQLGAEAIGLVSKKEKGRPLLNFLKKARYRWQSAMREK